MNTRVIQVCVSLVLLLGAGAGVKAAVDAQRPKGGDVRQVSTLLYECERAAERRNARGVNRYISEGYQDAVGLNDSQLKYQIGDFLRRHQSVDVDIPSRSVQIDVAPDGRTATLTFHLTLAVDTAGGGTGASEMNLGLRLAKERVYYYGVFPGEEWRVIGAEGYTPVE